MWDTSYNQFGIVVANGQSPIRHFERNNSQNFTALKCGKILKDFVDFENDCWTVKLSSKSVMAKN